MSITIKRKSIKTIEPKGPTLIGIVGFGNLGQGIYEYLQRQENLEVAWVWNRSFDKLADLPEDEILEDLEDIEDMPKKVRS